jgi:hypothetical protein
MDPTFGHPLWIFSGVALVLIGFLLFGWATSSDTAGQTADATGQGRLRKLFRRGQHTAPSTAATNARSKTRTNFRRAMSQLFGIIGFLLIVAGFMAAVFGVFYPGE